MNRLLPHATIKCLARRRSSKLVITSVKIPRQLDRDLKAEARKQDRSSSWVIREALQSYVTFRKVKGKADGN